MEEKVTFTNSKGDKLVGVLDLVDENKEALILVMTHGIFSNSSKERSTGKVASELDKKGINTFRFDMFGHGESDGELENITITEVVDDFLQAVEFLKSKGYKNIALMGSSFSSLAALVAATKLPQLKLLILRSAIFNYPEKVIAGSGIQTLLDWRRKGFRIYHESHGDFKVNYNLMQDFKNNDGFAACLEVSIPTLIVHGEKDEDAPVEQSRKASKLIENCKYVEIEGGDHGLSQPQHFQQLVDAVIAFIEDTK